MNRNYACYRHTGSAQMQAEKGGSGLTTGLSGPGVKFSTVCGITLKARGARPKLGRFAKILNVSRGRMPAGSTKIKTRANIVSNA